MTPEEARQVLCETLETDGELFEVDLLVDALLAEREALATLLTTTTTTTTMEPGPDPIDLASIAEALESGLLAMINQAVLWPRGLALRVHLDTDGQVLGMDFWNAGEYICGWIDNPEDDARMLARVRALRAAELEREAVATGRLPRPAETLHRPPPTD